MKAASEVVGAVLAGGESRRMGTDKARLELAGESLGARAVRALAAEMEEVVVVSRSSGDHADLGAVEIADRTPGNGPLGGIDAALAHARGRPVFVLACDLPRVGPDLIAHLLELALPAIASGEVAAAVPALDERLQPLCAVYGPACRAEIERRLADRELRVLDLIEAIGALRVDLGRDLPFFRRDLLDNVNDPRAAGRVAAELAAKS